MSEKEKMNCDQISNQAATAADDSDRIRKVFESKAQAVMINSLVGHKIKECIS